MFERVTIRAISPTGWPIDFELKPGQQPAQAVSWLTEHGYRPAIQAAPTQEDGRDEYGAFPADKLTATVDDGDVYWKVRSGQYQKFGVTIWPEVLEAAGLDADKLNPLQPMDLTGWTAHYILGDSGNPKKVIKLEKQGT